MDYDELVSRCLAEFQARVDVGVTTSDPDDSELAAPPEIRQRIQRGRECILLLSDGGAAPTRGDVPYDETKEIAAPSLANNGREKQVVQPNGSPTNGQPHNGQKSIGRFQIRAELGSGGFGIVYRAWDPRTEREVALKIPKFESLASADLQRRFEQEARAAARLDHPNIVGVLEAGTDGLLPFIASAYYPGVTLAEWHRKRDRPVAPRDAAQLILNLALALEHAHQRGVLHRDIKPSNILLVSRLEETSEGFLSSAVPKLMDFGLAKLASEMPDITRTGTMLGTLRYMPPEQAMGNNKAIGPRSDVFGLGVVLYELLAGTPPLQADNEIELLRKIPVEQPSNIRRSRPSVPVDLETITFKCLEKEPSRRYASAQELADDLHRFLQGMPIQARPATRPERLVKWIRRNPVWAALWAVSGLAIFAIVTGLAWSNYMIRGERDRARASEVRANQYIYSTDIQLAQDAVHNHNLIQSQHLLSRYVVEPGERDYRDFSWGFLNQLLRRYEAKLPNHPGDVYSVAFSEDGRYLATACRDGKTRVWSWPERKLIRELGDHTGEVNEVAYSPDGRWLATGGDDGRVLLRDAGNFTIRHELMHGEAAEPKAIVGLVFAPDCQRLYTGASHDLSAWNVESGKLEISRSAGELIRGLCISPDGSLLATAQTKSTVWRVPDLEVVSKSDRGAIAASCCFLPDSQRLVLSEEGKLVVHGALDGAVQKDRSNNHRAFARALATRPKSRVMVSASDDQVIEVRDIVSWGRIGTYLGHTQRIWDMALAPDGRQFVSAGADGEVLVWSLPCDTRYERADGGIWRAAFPNTPSIAYSPDGSLMAAACKRDYVAISDLATGASTLLPIAGAKIADAVFTPDSQSLIAADSNGNLMRCDMQTGAVSNVCTVPQHLWPNSLALSPSCDRLAVGSFVESCVVLLDWPSGRELHRFALTDGAANAVRFTADGRRLIIATGPALSWFDLQSYACVHRHQKPGHSDLAVFSDGKRLACAEGRDGVVIRSLDTGEELDRLSGHTGDVIAVAVHPNGRNIASLCSDRQLRIWDLTSGSALLKFTDLIPPDWGGLKFSATGDELLTVHDTTLHELMAFETKPSPRFDLVDPHTVELHLARWTRWPIAAAVTRRTSTLALGSRVRAVAWQTLNGYTHAALQDGGVVAVSPDEPYPIIQVRPVGQENGPFVSTIVFDPAGKRFFTASSNGELAYHNIQGNNPAEHRIPESADYLTYSENFEQLVFAAGQQLIAVNAATGKEQWRREMPARVSAIAKCKPNQVAVVSDDDKLRIFDFASGELQSETSFESGITGPQGLVWSEDAERLIAVRSRRVSLYEWGRLSEPWNFEIHDERAPEAFFWGGDRLVVRDGVELRVYDHRQRKLVAVLMAPGGGDATFNSKQGILATFDRDQITYTWLSR